MTSRVTSARVVGREHELAELQAAFADALSGRPGLAFVAGESGVGKSRLLGEAERRMAAAGARVLRGDCFDLGEGELPYAPLVAALRPLARGGDPALDALDADLRAELATFLPGLTGTPGSSQGRLFEALLALFDHMAAERPLVLLIEDLHWADSSTRAFLSFLARSVCDQALLVVASYRPDELHRRHPLKGLLAALERDPRARRIALQAFTEAELTEQLADILGAPPQRDLVRRLWVRSEGNPLYTEELLAAGLDGRGGLPPTLRDALMLRVERLPAAAQDVVRLLAAGQRLPHDVLADAADLEPRELREALREAVADHILAADEDGSYAFRHALLREVVVDDLLPGEQSHLHMALARALERRAAATADGPGVYLSASIAHHWFSAGDQPAALVAAVRAAQAAERVHAHAEAAALYERALELWARVPDAAERTGCDEAHLLYRTAQAHDAGQDPARVIALLERALGLVDEAAEPERVARMLERTAQAEWSLNRQEAALTTAQRALDLLPAGEPSAARATVLGWWAKRLMLMGRYRRAVDVAGEAIDEARAVGDPGAESRARNALGVALMSLGEVDEGSAALRAALELARAADAPRELSSAFVNLSDALHIVGRSEEAIEVARRGLTENADRGESSWMRYELAEFLVDTGRLDEAAELLRVQDRRPNGTAAMFHTLVSASLALHRGEHAALREHLEAIRENAERTMEPQFSGPYGALSAELALREGDLDGARAVAAAALDRILTCTDDGARVSRVAAIGVDVEVAAAQRARDAGDQAALVVALGQAEVLAGYVSGAAGRPVEDARAASAQAALACARGADDPRAWIRAAEAWKAVGRPLAAGADRLRAAEAALARDDRELAAGQVAAVLAEAEPRGAGWLAREARGLAARARLRLAAPAERQAVAQAARPVEDPDTVLVEDPFGLTPRELQVLALVAEGATNRQIGEELYMAEKTASVHVSRILAKLDVRSRTQAAAVAHRSGLLLRAPQPR